MLDVGRNHIQNFNCLLEYESFVIFLLTVSRKVKTKKCRDE